MTEILERVKSGELQPWWNLDDYLMAHLAELLTKLRNEGHGWSLRFENAEAWNKYLTGLITAFEAYDVDDVLAYANAQQALHEVAAHLRDFWD